MRGVMSTESGKPDAGEVAKRLANTLFGAAAQRKTAAALIADGLADFQRETLLWVAKKFRECHCASVASSHYVHWHGQHYSDCRLNTRVADELERLAESCGRK